MRDNIIHGSNILWMMGVIFSILSGTVSAQPADNTLQVIDSRKLYLETVQKDSNQRMEDLRQRIPSLVFDLRYATKDNFVKQPLYPATRTSFLRLPAAKALAGVQAALKTQGLGLKIFDAYRPYGVTKKMWEIVHDSRYVADPAKGSGHNRGIAVDLTLIDLSTGKELPMPTGFDNFSDSAHQDFRDLPEESIRNRLLLKTVMEKYGFEPLKTEWWHFSLPQPGDFKVLDLPFDELDSQDTRNSQDTQNRRGTRDIRDNPKPQ
ncbi:MAG: M15 family metallopeptidase [Puia sp.]|nr:M15 family metallopeptidase [Puia sp.]